MGLDEAQQLIMKHRYREAAQVLDKLLTQDRENGELWYLRGVASLKMKNYDGAQEYLERALSTGRKAKYFQMMGMAHFELFELKNAISAFDYALGIDSEDVTSAFFSAISYMLLDDPRSTDYLKRAYEISGKRTRQLLLNFYALFLKDDPRISDAQKSKILRKIRALNAPPS